MKMKFAMVITALAALLMSPLESAKLADSKMPSTKRVWEKFALKGNCCQIAFPTKPSHQTKVHSWADTKMTLSYDAYYAKGATDFETMVFVIQYPSEIANNQKDDVYRGVLQGFINHYANNRLVYFKPVLAQQNQGIEFIVQNDKQFFLGRAFIKGNQLFFLIFQCRSLQTNQQSYQNFVESINWK